MCWLLPLANEFMRDVRDAAYNCVVHQNVGVPTCELVDANVAACVMSVSSSQFRFTSAIAKSAASNLRRHSVFLSSCLARVFILPAEHSGFGQETPIVEQSWTVPSVQHVDHASGINRQANLRLCP